MTTDAQKLVQLIAYLRKHACGYSVPLVDNNTLANWLEAAHRAQQEAAKQAPSLTVGDGCVLYGPSDKRVWQMIENAQRANGLTESVALNAAMKQVADAAIAAVSIGPDQPAAQAERLTNTHKLDAAWAKAHLDAIRQQVPAEALHSLDCVRSWLLSHPAKQAERKPLTDDEIGSAHWDDLGTVYFREFEAGVRFAERAHGIGKDKS